LPTGLPYQTLIRGTHYGEDPVRSQPLPQLATPGLRLSLMDRADALTGDVQQEVHTERDVDAALFDLEGSHQPTAGARSEAPAPLPPEPASHQVVVGDIPAEPPGFRPRLGLFAELDRAGARVSVIQAAAGLHGLGATQLAAAYARAKLEAGWRLVAWVNSADTGSLLAGLAAVADATGLTYDDSGRGITDATATVRYGLETDGDRCLLVFDDVSDPAVLQEFIPAYGTARVLITSTRQSAANLGSAVAVDLFSTAEASAFLAERTGLDDEAGAASVAAELAHVPLALALAAPVIAARHVGYARYLDRLEATPADAYPTGHDDQSYPPGVVRTVLVSLQAARAADRTGVCARVMQIMSVLSAGGVRRELLYAAGQVGVLASGRHRVTVGLLDRVLQWLSDRSLLTFSQDGQTVILHRLVARVIRNELDRSQMLTAVREAAAFALDVYSRAQVGSQDRRAVRAIPQHVTTLLDSPAGSVTKIDGELALLLLRLRLTAFHHLLELGDSTAQAIAVGEPLAEDLERLLGPDHPDTLNSRNSIAAAYLAAGRVAEAIPLFEQMLAVRQRMLDPDDREVLTAQNNLASAYQDAGRTAEAIRLYELNLEVREQLLGPDDPSTLTSRGNLAAAYQDAGRTAEAIPLLQQTLAGRERILGTDHPDAQTSRKNLAKAYQDAGRAAEAIPLLQQTLAGRKRVIRIDAAAQTSRKNLANADPAADRVAGAILPTSQTRGTRKNRPSDGPAGQMLPVVFRWPPIDQARPLLPTGLRRPPADPARWRLPDSPARTPAKATDHSAIRTQDPPEDVQYDRQIIAAVTAEDPAGMAMMYDKFAAALYGYCHRMLHDPADAAGALKDTFVIAAMTLGELSDPGKLRPWLFALARSECRRRIRPASAARDEETGEVGRTPDATRQASDEAREASGATVQVQVITRPANGRTHVDSDRRQTELRTLIYSILTGLGPREREVIELSFRHDLREDELAIALGVSSSRAQALAARARGRLEKALSALRIALTGRNSCPVLGEFLADWDGQLTEDTRDLVLWHIEECWACGDRNWGALPPATFSRLLPLAPVPPELRMQVLSCCTSTDEDVVAYRQRVTRRAESIWVTPFSSVIRHLSWASIRANPGKAIAAVAVAVWVGAAMSITLLTFAGSHAAYGKAVRPTGRASAPAYAPPANAVTSPPSPAAAPTTANPSASVASPSPTSTQSAVQVRPTPPPSPETSVSSSPKPSKSAGPSNSASPSPSSTTPPPSPTTSPSPSSTTPPPSPTTSPSPSSTTSPTASSSASPTP
jgi:RNA polymerase sigma factor (sigma-70 family)